MQKPPHSRARALLHSAFCILNSRFRRALAIVLTSALVCGSFPAPAAAATEFYGQVIFAGVAVPGATVTASQGEVRLTTSTDAQGIFRFTDIADGGWTLQVEMRGFATLSRDVTIGPDVQPAMWELSLLPFEEITRGLPSPAPRPARAPEPNNSSASTRSQSNAPRPATPQTGFQRAGVATSQQPPRQAAAAPPA